MVEVYARAQQERFIASRWSLAYLFRLCWYIAIAISPIYIAYSSGGFWRRSDSFLEQPRVLFTKNLIAVGHAADGTRVIQYSTMERFNLMVGYDNVKQPAIKSWSTDPNLDTKADTIDVNLVFPLTSSDAPVVSLSLLLFFELSFDSGVPLVMNGVVQLLGHGGGVRGNKVQLVGDLEFIQRNALPRNSGTGTRRAYQYPVVNDSTILGIDDTDLATIMMLNEARNETLRVTPRSVWSMTPASVFNASVHLTIPSVPVLYIPGPSEAIKFAFIQWLAMFWILYFAMKFIRDFVYNQNIVDTTRIMDGTPLAKLHQF